MLIHPCFMSLQIIQQRRLPLLGWHADARQAACSARDKLLQLPGRDAGPGVAGARLLGLEPARWTTANAEVNAELFDVR